MILCDTSMIVGAINAGDKDHARCLATLSPLEQPLVTTHACVTEAMHLLGNYAGWNGQAALIAWIEADFLTIHPECRQDDIRTCALMRQYADVPMDFADASIVAAAETLGISRVLTFDGHFYAYRMNGKTPFEVLPA